MDHFPYCVELVGIEHVAFGPDTLYGDHVGLHTTFAGPVSLARMGGPSYEKVELRGRPGEPDRELREHLRLAGHSTATPTTTSARSPAATSTGHCSRSGSRRVPPSSLRRQRRSLRPRSGARALTRGTSVTRTHGTDPRAAAAASVGVKPIDEDNGPITTQPTGMMTSETNQS